MAKRRATPGTKQLGLEIDDQLLAALRGYAKGRGETLREVVERAVRRDMANPPPPPPDPPPLPPMPAADISRGKPKKGRAKK